MASLEEVVAQAEVFREQQQRIATLKDTSRRCEEASPRLKPSPSSAARRLRRRLSERAIWLPSFFEVRSELLEMSKRCGGGSSEG